jgi:hypothetical protein
VGTPKRERQKANRLQRQIEDARAERVGTVKRTVLRIAVIAVIAIVAVVLIAWIGGAFSDDESGGGGDAAVAVPTAAEVVR